MIQFVLLMSSSQGLQKIKRVASNGLLQLESSWCDNNINVDKVLSKKFKPPSPHILDIYFYFCIDNIASTFGQSCFLPLLRRILTLMNIQGYFAGIRHFPYQKENL